MPSSRRTLLRQSSLALLGSVLPGCSKKATDTATADPVDAATATRSARVFPTPPGNASFPEMKNPRYQRSVGLAISGGSMRSFSCSIGQLSALTTLGLLPEIGHMSTLSGSAWFGSLFNYIDTTHSDEALLGKHTKTAPESLVFSQLESMDPSFIGYPVAELDDQALIEGIHLAKQAGYPLNRRFGASIGRVLLGHFGLYDLNKYFSLDAATVADLVGRNPDLSSEDFFTMRPDRPYWIASSSAVKPGVAPPYMHQFEYSPLYCGTAQETSGYGGGYVENIGFDTRNPASVSQDGIARLAPPTYPFTLSDLMGSSGAAPGIVFDKLKLDQVFAQFEYWPVYSPTETKSELYSFNDGGDLEDTSLVAILRRNYPTVISFINGAYALGTDDRDTVDGVNSNITRLFGHRPKAKLLNDQDTQIFENEPGASGDTPFEALVKGLHATRDALDIAHHLGTYRIKEGNPFGLEPREVKILWVYNDLNLGWAAKLPSDIQRFMDEKHGPHKLNDFPNFKSVFEDGPQMFSIEPYQIQLLANMWHYSVAESRGLRKKLEGLF